MIQSPALTPALPLALPAEGLPVSSGEAAQGADFGALLAITITSPNPPNEPDAPVFATQIPISDCSAEPADAASSGKSLPPTLPPVLSPLALSAAEPALAAEAVSVSQSAPDDTGADAKLTLSEQKPLAIALPKLLRGKLRTNASEPRGPAEPSSLKFAAPAAAEPDDTAVPIVAVPTTQLAALQPQIPLIKPATSEVPPAPVQPSDSTASPELAVPQPKPQAQQAFDHAAPQAAFLRALAPQDEPQSSRPPPSAEPSAPAPIRPLRIELALSPQVAPAARAASPMTLRRIARIESDVIAAPTFTASNPAPQTQPQTIALPLALDRPQDFTALLDRLVAAREAAAPQRVSVTLPHAEFGPVHLRFRQEDGALAVSMTSADPDFARAASLSPPPVVPTAEVRSAPNQSDHSATAANTGSGQSCGQSAERRGEQTARENPAPRSAGPDKSDRRNGIFA